MPIHPDKETEVVIGLEHSEWYQYALDCGHVVYSRIRLKYEKPNRQHHRIRCPQCDVDIPKGNSIYPSSWRQIETITEVDNEHVSNVLSGTAFILPNRIMRLDNGPTNSAGNVFPYTTKDRDY